MLKVVSPKQTFNLDMLIECGIFIVQVHTLTVRVVNTCSYTVCMLSEEVWNYFYSGPRGQLSAIMSGCGHLNLE